MASSRIYVGNLPSDVRRDEVEHIFRRYGRIVACDIKPGRDNRAPSYAFLEFTDPRDAYDAVRGEDQRGYAGARLKVEESKGGRVSSTSRGPPSRSSYRVRVLGLPASASWQDLKDHMRSAGDVGYSDVSKVDGVPIGVVEYRNAENMEEALRRLNGSEFANRFGDKAILTVEEEKGSGGGGGRGYEDRGRGGASAHGGQGGYHGGHHDDRRGGGGYEDRAHARGGEDRGRDRSRSRERAPPAAPNGHAHVEHDAPVSRAAEDRATEHADEGRRDDDRY